MIRRACLLPLLVLLACQERAEAPSQRLAAITAFQGMPALPAGPVAGRPWARQACRSGQLQPEQLACVDGVAITRGQFAAVQPSYPPGTPARDIVQALVDAEVLAKAAADKGLWSDWLVPVERRAMVARLLAKTQEEALTPAKVSDADLQTAFKNPQIRLHYDHVTGWYATDVQLLCCKGDWRQCDKREEVRACIDKTEAQARSLYQKLATDPPRTAAELKARVARMESEFPLAAVQDVQFWYDKGKPYDQQKGYDLMVKEFALPVVEMQPGDLGQPIRSPFGWHIPRLERIEPEVHKTWRDPDVRKDIAAHVIDAIREREVQHFTFGLLHQYGVQFAYDVLDRPAP